MPDILVAFIDTVYRTS